MDDKEIAIVQKIFEFHRDSFRGRNWEKLQSTVSLITKRKKRGTDQTIYSLLLANGNRLEIIRYNNSNEVVIYPHETAKSPRYIEWDYRLGVAFDRNYYAAR